MFFRKKKKESANIGAPDAVQAVLRDALAAMPRVEGAAVSYGVAKPIGLPCGFVKTLGPTLREELGEAGGFALCYDAEEKELILRVTFSYAEDSGEMELIRDDLPTADDEDELLPGDLCYTRIMYTKDAAKSTLCFHSEGVEERELRPCADRLLDRVNDWLDVLSEIFEEEYKEQNHAALWAEKAKTALRHKEILKTELETLPRLEGRAVAAGREAATNAVTAYINSDLGPTLSADLGEDGALALTYRAPAETLSLTLTYSYHMDSEEMKFYTEQIETSFDDDYLDEQKKDSALFPGTVCDVLINYYTNDDRTDVVFTSENVKSKDLKKAADRLLDTVNDWLDSTAELFEG